MAYGARLESGLGAIPQGFKSPILRQRKPSPSCGGFASFPLCLIPFVAILVISAAVACPSGQRSAPRKRVWGQPHRGFKSHRHRHTFSREYIMRVLTASPYRESLSRTKKWDSQRNLDLVPVAGSPRGTGSAMVLPIGPLPQRHWSIRGTDVPRKHQLFFPFGNRSPG